MPEELVVRHCAPTLAGLKTGNMFTYACTSREEMNQGIRKMNQLLRKKGVRVIPLRYDGSRALIYFYRPGKLQQDLANGCASGLLRNSGYSWESPGRCVAELVRRLQKNPEFPHEIGLFLGYPPEDVVGFIKNRAERSKCTGFWKVYGDKEKAEKTFAAYRKCTSVYYRHWQQGASLGRLTVAAR